MRSCPFHQNNPDLLASHAMHLESEGLGPVSRMIRESVLAKEIDNPDLAVIHATEAAKFSAMAQRIAPPELVAGSIEKLCNPYPAVTLLEDSALQKAFMAIIQRTKGLPGAPNGRFDLADTREYLHLCSKDPCLFLSCFYLSLGLHSVVNTLTKHIDSDSIRQDLTDFSLQFNAANLCIALPLAISISLFKLKGEAASADQIDREVITAALNNLHQTGQFQITARNTSSGGIASFKCPMQGYLFNLLGQHRVMETIIESIRKTENDPTDLSKIAVDDADKVTRKEIMLLIHKHNRDMVKNLASLLHQHLP